MIRYFFLVLLLSPILIVAAETNNSAKEYRVGDQFEPYTLETQHQKPHTMSPNTKVVLVSFEMDLSKQIHQWLEQKDQNYLKDHQAEYLADISDMPDIITYLFAGPKMRRYQFPIIWAREDNFDLKYPKSAGRLTVLKLDDQNKITNIYFLKNMDEVANKVLDDKSIMVKKES